MADFEPFQLGNILQQAEEIRGLRGQNVLLGQKARAQNLLQERASMFNPLAQRFFAGETDVANQLFQLDPERAEQAVSFQRDISEDQRLEEQREADIILLGANNVRLGGSPSTNLRLFYPEFREQLLEQGATEEQLNDDDFLRDTVSPGLIAHYFPLTTPGRFSAKDFGLAEPEGAFIQFKNPKTGEVKDVRRDSAEADVLAADPNFQQVSRVQRIEQGGPRAFTDTQAGKRELDFETQARNTAGVVNLLDRITDQITEGGASILSIVGTAQRFAGQVGATIDASAQVFGIDLSPDNFDFSDFDKGAVKSARVRSNVIKLSFLIALARNPSGRITEPDVQAAVREIGVSADPKQFLGVLQEVRGGIIADFNILARQQRQSASGFEEFVAPLLPRSVRRIDGTLTLPTDNSDAAIKKRLGLSQ